MNLTDMKIILLILLGVLGLLPIITNESLMLSTLGSVGSILIAMNLLTKKLLRL